MSSGPPGFSNRNGSVLPLGLIATVNRREPSWGQTQGAAGSSSDFNPTSNFLQDVFKQTVS